LPSAVARITGRALFWNGIACLDMQRKNLLREAVGPKESIIKITVPVGPYDIHWDHHIVKQMRIILQAVNVEYESVPIYVVQRDTSSW